ncbi:HNH endonuclease family protein [Nocardioides ferulae]|uniref:HNH endonuclease family protein n=1 Tax=Nocardioides ferulae TaxID=2340821 RepID=UPI001981BA38|nr:HNH endonuclease family protein [Nocardioides ferulae]
MPTIVVLLLTLLPLAGPAAPSPAPFPATSPASPSARAGAWSGSYPEAVAALPVRREVRDGYDRDEFNHWIGQGDGCDTRDVVLIDESLEEAEVGEDCAVSGRWHSAYDGVETVDASSFDIDHVVPLAESWDSGSRSWDDERRERFANDLGDRRSLLAVSASSNRSKGDQDPAEWMPDQGRCRYVRGYVAVKLRWGLSVDRAEKRFLRKTARRCPARQLKVRVVPVD